MKCCLRDYAFPHRCIALSPLQHSISACTPVEHQENEAVVKALCNSILPRLDCRDADMFASLVHDLWPHSKVDMSRHDQLSEIDEDEEIDANSRNHTRGLYSGIYMCVSLCDLLC